MKKANYIPLCILLWINHSVYSQSHTIEYNLKPGDQFTTEFISEVNLKQTVIGIEQAISMKMETDIYQKVETVRSDKGYDFLTEYRRMLMRITSDYFSHEIDTEKKSKNDLMNQLAKGVLNKPFSVSITRNGQLRDVKGLSTIINDLMEKTEMNSEEREDILTQFEKNIGEENLQQNFIHFFGLYPGKAVKKGETWEIKYQLAHAEMIFDFSGKGTLMEVNQKNFLIRVEGNLHAADPDKINDHGQRILLEGTQVSEITVDRKSGWPVKAVSTQDVSGILILPSPDHPGSLIEIPMQMKMRINLRAY